MNFKATVAILSFNSPAEIIDLVSKLKEQTLYKQSELEILVIESSNKDIYRKQISDFITTQKETSIKYVEINNKDFGHGKSRNYAAKLAGGKYLIFITQDALPASNDSLEKLIQPFTLDKNIKLVTGKQIPHNDCNPIMANWIEEVFSQFNIPQSSNFSTIIYYPDLEIPGREFNSNVFAAYDKDFLLTELPFPEVNYAEDMIFAMLLSKTEYLKAYKSDAIVKHSHSWQQPINYFQRIFDEHVGLQKATGHIEHSIKLSNFHYKLFTNTLKNYHKIVISNISIFGKIKWLWKALPIEYYRLSAVILAKKYQQISDKDFKLFSREAMQRELKQSQLNLIQKIKVDHLINVYFFRLFWDLISAKLTLLGIYQSNFGFFHGILEFIKNKGKDTPSREQNYNFTKIYFQNIKEIESIGKLKINQDIKKVAWIVPAFGKLSGGMESITRLIQEFKENGKECEVFIIPPFYFANSEISQKIYNKYYLETENNIKVTHLDNPENQLKQFDLVVATEWRTAYYAFNAYLNKIPVVYFVQDLESMFFPAGSVAEFAKQTYKFPYKFITISPWLTEVLKTDYKINDVDNIEIGYDPNVYINKQNYNERENRIAIYARKNTDRRGWELLELLLPELNESIKIDIFGIEDDLKIKALHPGIKSHGIISKDKINEIYNNAKLGITFSFTNYSINPQEMNATGLPVIDIDWEGNRVNYKDRKGLVLLDSDPIKISKWINERFSDKDTILSEMNKILSENLDVETWESQKKKFYELVIT